MKITSDKEMEINLFWLLFLLWPCWIAIGCGRTFIWLSDNAHSIAWFWLNRWRGDQTGQPWQ